MENSKFAEEVEAGQRVVSMWNGELGWIKYTTELRRTSGTVVVLWDNGHTTKEIWKCDVKADSRTLII